MMIRTRVLFTLTGLALLFACGSKPSDKDVVRLGNQLVSALAKDDFAAFDAISHPKLREMKMGPEFALFSRAVAKLGAPKGDVEVKSSKSGTSKVGKVVEVQSSATFERGRIELNYWILEGQLAKLSIEEDETFAPLLREAREAMK